MFQPWTSARLKAELDALQASAERAGHSLACVYSSSQEFEAAMLRVCRRRGLMGATARIRLVLAATAAVAVIALAALAF